MQRMFKTAAIAGALATGFAGTASAQSEVDQLRAEMAQMRADMAQMRAQQQGDWMTEARAEEVRGLINEVLADANTRATLLQEGAMAGIDSKGKVFLKSADGDFSMNVSGQLQMRYIWNSEDNRADESVSGFQMRRTKVKLAGDVADNWGYTLVFAGDRAGGSVAIEDAIIHYEASDSLTVNFGAQKLPFARQELISSSRQVSADRALATEFFTLNRSEGVQVNYENDRLRLAGMISDGANNSYTDFNAAHTPRAFDFAVTGRADYMILGDDWDASKHAFGQEEKALFVGGALNYSKFDPGAAAADDQLNWTIDALFKGGNFGVMAAVFGSSTTANAAGVDTDAFGWFVQGDYVINTQWDVFARYDFIDDDTADELDAITFGVNHHVNKNVKVTGDIVYIIDSDNPDAIGALADGEDSSGMGVTGLADNSGEDQIILRLQLQLLF